VNSLGWIVNLVLATNQLTLGGSESYLITVAEQLDRLGHGVFLYSPEGGEAVAVARERGLRVGDASVLPAGCDAALVQDAGVSLQLAGRYPSTPQLFVAHSEIFDLQAPPQLDGAVGLVVALSDRVARRMRAFAERVEVVRLRQPIDTERFLPRAQLPEVPRRALLLSNTPKSDRIEAIEWACSRTGLELSQVGGAAGRIADPRHALAGTDIVIGYGRSILEAMACGRAAYVYDWHGGDGWVTGESYEAIEADGIGGRGGRAIVDREGLAADLRRYSASMGPVNHDLAMAHHRANVHAQELVELLRGLAEPPQRPREPLEEMARLVRLEWRARLDAHALMRENAELRAHLRESQEAARDAARSATGHAKRSYERSRSWRLTAPLRAAGRLLRGDGMR
jgi:hypothetical protein